jgi:thiol-disulfide isomerase/thioredoxin
MSRAGLIWFGAIVVAFGVFGYPKAAPAADEPTNYTMVTPPRGGRLVNIFTEQARLAEEMGRKPFAYFWADWCAPCRALRRSLDDERMIDAFDGTYIIMIDYDRWRLRIQGTDFQDLIDGIPAFLEIDQTGHATSRMIDGSAWGQDIPENMAPALKAFFSGESAPANSETQ